MPDTVTPLSFDYQTLDTKTAQFVQKQTSAIKGLFRQSIQNILRIGQILLQVKERLPHGQWLDWLDLEFGWTDRTARNYMQAAQEFKLETISDLNFAAKAIYDLASPSTPEEAREEAINRAQTGERITVAAAREIRDKHRTLRSDSALESDPPIRLEPQEWTSDPGVLETQSRSYSLPTQPLARPLPGVEPKSITPSKRKRAKAEKPLVIAPRQVQPKEWWKLGQDNYLYCGDPASTEFQRVLSESIALSLVSPPSRDAWPQSLSPTSISTASIFTPYLAEQDLSLYRQIMDGYLQLYTEGGDTVALSFLPDPAILPLIIQLDCRFFCADPDPKRCDEAITVWTTVGQSAERMKTRQGKKRLSSPALSRR